LHVITFEPQLEQRILESLRPTESGPMVVLDPTTAQAVLGSLSQLLVDAENRNIRPVLVCAPQVRSAVHRMITMAVDRLPVLSYSELNGNAQIRSVGTVTGERLMEVTA
jgi:flagellar biosynthesis protein FlhA